MFTTNFKDIILDNEYLCNTCCHWFNNSPTCCNKCCIKYCSKDCFLKSCVSCLECRRLYHRCSINNLKDKCYKCEAESKHENEILLTQL